MQKPKNKLWLNLSTLKKLLIILIVAKIFSTWWDKLLDIKKDFLTPLIFKLIKYFFLYFFLFKKTISARWLFLLYVKILRPRSLDFFKIFTIFNPYL